MSYKYLKSEIKAAYPDPEGTIDKFCVNYDYGLDAYPSTIIGIMLYVKDNSLLFRTKLDPERMLTSVYKPFYLDIPYYRIIMITIGGIPVENIDTIIKNLKYDPAGYILTIVFNDEQNNFIEANFNVSCYIRLSKNYKTINDIINALKSSAGFNERFQSSNTLSYTKINYTIPKYDKYNSGYLILTEDYLILCPHLVKSINTLRIPYISIISFELKKVNSGMGRTFHEESYLELKFNDDFDVQTTVIIKLGGINTYNRSYEEFLIKLSDLDILDKLNFKNE